MLRALNRLLADNRELLTLKWSNELHNSSESYRRRPKYELIASTRRAFNANLEHIINKNSQPINDFIDHVVTTRFQANFKLPEIQNAFEIYRQIIKPIVIENIPKANLEEALNEIDAAVSYAVYRFSEKYQSRHELEIMHMNQVLTNTLEALKIEKDNVMTANMLKDQFLANVSHELRTPLTSIIGFSKILMGGCDKNPNMKEKLQVIYDQGKTLLHMISTLILIAEINAGTAKRNLDAVNLSDLAAFVIADIKKLPIAKEHSINLSVSDSLPVLMGDSEKLQFVIYELLHNAVKFSSKETSVEVDIHKSVRGLVLKVKDDGIGISPDNVAAIFNPFYQTDGSTTREYGGSGLGLTMIQKVAELHGGKVGVESRRGNGSTFILELPC